jgi:hypothetical protein
MQTQHHNHTRPSDAVLNRLLESPLARQAAADMDREQQAAHDAHVTRAADLRVEVARMRTSLQQQIDTVDSIELESTTQE